ncbi:MIZ/SP-RING zinc finger domain-containing protein [Ditylenchus destructor]|nr:MIZ/SP-RING zinc finger domain-containing protein [Ditylenchus destructor]
MPRYNMRTLRGERVIKKKEGDRRKRWEVDYVRFINDARNVLSVEEVVKEIAQTFEINAIEQEKVSLICPNWSGSGLFRVTVVRVSSQVEKKRRTQPANQRARDARKEEERAATAPAARVTQPAGCVQHARVPLSLIGWLASSGDSKLELRRKLALSPNEHVRLFDLTKERIVTPVRYRTCRHFQCFDLKGFFAMKAKRNFLECPICNSKLDNELDGLCIDKYFQKMLSEVIGATETEILSDGTFRAALTQSALIIPKVIDDEEPYAPDHSTTHIGEVKSETDSNVDDIEELDSVSSFDIMPDFYENYSL